MRRQLDNQASVGVFLAEHVAGQDVHPDACRLENPMPAVDQHVNRGPLAGCRFALLQLEGNEDQAV